MRILQVCNKPPYPPRDGGSIAMYNLADALDKLGHSLTVLTMYTGKHGFTDEQQQECSKRMPVHAVYMDTAPNLTGLLRNLIFSRLPYNASRFISATFKNKLTALLKSQTFDVIQLEGLYLAPYIPVIRLNSRALVALRAHNIEHEIWERIADQEKNLFRKQYFRILAGRIRLFESRYLNTCDLLVPITQRDLAQFNKLGNINPAFVCPAGVNTFTDSEAGTMNAASENGGISDESSPFFLGSLDWIPNQEGLLWFTSEVLPLLTQQYPQLKFHVAGRNAPDKLVKKLDVPGVLFYGEIVDAREFMKSKGILVSPCFSGSGMRLKIVEAMALGKPVVTTSIGAEGLAVEHNRNILIANNASEFYLHLERLMNNPDLCKKIGQHAHEFATAHFNNPVIASALAGFYKEHIK